MQLKRYTFALDNKGKDQHLRLATDADVSKVLSKGEDGKLTSPSEHIWRLIELEQEKFPQLDQKTAVERVRKNNPALFRLYASESNGKIRIEQVA